MFDSSSSDDTVALARGLGFDVQVIPKPVFNHGATDIWRSIRRGLALCALGNALPDETRPLADSLRSAAYRVEMAGIQAGRPASGIAASYS